jgi:ribosomal protein S18 acetylase RimI-like enzyme
MQVEVRLADLSHPRDASAVVDLIDSYAADPLGRSEPLTDEVRERLGRDLQRHGALVFLAWNRPLRDTAADHALAPADSDANPLGVAVCFRTYSTFRGAPLINVHDLCVSPAARDRGVGRALLRAIEDYAVSAGCSKLTLEVRLDNSRARHLYRSVGFREATPPMLFWQKFLHEPTLATKLDGIQLNEPPLNEPAKGVDGRAPLQSDVPK